MIFFCRECKESFSAGKGDQVMILTIDCKTHEENPVFQKMEKLE